MDSAKLLIDATHRAENSYTRSENTLNEWPKRRREEEYLAEQTQSRHTSAESSPQTEDEDIEEQLQDYEADMIALKRLSNTLGKLKEMNNALRKERKGLRKE
eukprot:10111482-Ditylum_brightwellii.AAC.1